MQFLQLVLQNFGPYVGRQEIDLRPREIDGVPAPIVLFGGMNGGGKTTLMDAIRLALYGQRAQCSTRGNLSYSDFLGQCVNRHAPPTDLTQIELLFEQVVNGKPTCYRVVRTWNNPPKDGRDSLGIYEPDNLGNSDWKDEALSETWDEYIENLLPLSISNLFLFDGEQVKELAEQEAPPPVVVAAIQSLLGLELAQRLAVDLEILIQRKRKELAGKAERAAIEEIEARLARSQQEYETLEQQFEELKRERDRALKEEQAATATFRAEGGKFARKQSELQGQYKLEEATVEQHRDRLRELAAGALPLAMVRSLLESARGQAEREKRAKTAQLLQGAIGDRDARLLALLVELKIPKTKLAKVQQFLENDEPPTAEDLEIWLDLDEPQVDRLNALLGDRLDNSLRQNAAAQTTLRDALEQLTRTEQQLAVAASEEEGDRLFERMTAAQSARQRLEAAVEQCQRQLMQLSERLQKTRRELASYGEKNVDRQNANHLIDNAKSVQETLKQFRERLTLRKLNKLEIEVTECFRYLLHKSDLVHRVAIEADDFRLLLYDRQGQLVPKHRLSAGEKQLLAIAFLWGLTRVSGRQLPVAIDTPLGRLDSSHRSNLVERYFPAASHQVILLSTDTEIRQPEATQLRDCGAIAREYLLKYDAKRQETQIEPGYFHFGEDKG